jgi:HD-like signal output (HDOD) protein
MPKGQELERVIGLVGELPAMPAVVSEVLRLTEDPKAEMGRVGQVIESDPAMTAKILKVSNSSYYGMKQFVGTLKLALVILGVREVRNIVLGISVFDLFKDGKTDVKLAQAVWDESLRMAGLSKKISSGLNLGLQGEEFITGLLANIGQMVMLKINGKEYGELLLDLGSEPVALCTAEEDAFGYTHAEAASALASHWSLPQQMADALWCQYPDPMRPVSATSEPKLTAVLRISRAALRDDFDAPDSTPRSLQDEEAWAVLGAHARNPVAPDLRRPTLTGFLHELEKAPQVPL